MYVCIKRMGLRCAVHAVSPLQRTFQSASPHVCHKSCLSAQGHTACSSTNAHKHTVYTHNPWTHTYHISSPLSLKVSQLLSGDEDTKSQRQIHNGIVTLPLCLRLSLFLVWLVPSDKFRWAQEVGLVYVRVHVCVMYVQVWLNAWC